MIFSHQLTKTVPDTSFSTPPFPRQLSSWLLGERYQAACLSPSDLQAHLPALHELARDCKHVTDAGTGQGLSALAFLWAHPERLVCLDAVHTAEVDRNALWMANALNPLYGTSPWFPKGCWGKRGKSTGSLLIHAGV